MAKRQNQPISTWQDGDVVVGFALVGRKESRRDRNNKAFVDLELMDASGTISGKVWSDSSALEADFEAHDYVAVRGTVKGYRGQLQISVLDCRRATEEDRARGFDETLLIPSSKQDLGEMAQRLEALLDARVQHPMLRRLAQETLAVHGAALREHPAAKGIHHAYRGGLLEHTLSMAELAVAVAEHYPELDLDLLLLGVLFHDLGKLVELGAMPANDYTEPGRLVGHVVIGRDLLRERCASIEAFPGDVRLRLEHLVLSHQGRLDFGSPVEPMTPEALALHFIDDLDSKLDQLRGAQDRGGGMQWLRGLGRYVLLPESRPAVDEEEMPSTEDPQSSLEL
jgi:3'-5' exoribonuclease